MQIEKYLSGKIEHQKLYATLSFHHFITSAVDFISNYSKFCTDISRKLIALTPWKEFDLFEKLIFDCEKDEN